MLSIIIPAYNEEKRIGNTLKDYYDYFSCFVKKFEIIVVTDGCTDKTVEVVKSFRKKNIISLDFPEKLGKGGGIKEGFRIAKGDIIGFVDADESVTPKDFNEMVEKIKHYDCVVASRRTKYSKILEKQPLRRRILGRGYNILVNLLFGLGVKDTQCGAKVFRKVLIKIILKDVHTTGYSFDIDVLWKIKRNKFTIMEHPVTWMHMKEGQFNVRKHMFRMFVEVMKLRLRDL